MIKKLFNYVYDIIWLLRKRNYVLISSYPKTGSTILRMRLIADLHNLNIVNHTIVNNLSPEIGHGRIKSVINNYPLIVVKTHYMIFSLILSPRLIINTIREPNETLCSHYEYFRRQQQNSELASKLKIKEINSFIKSFRGYRWMKLHLLISNSIKRKITIISYKSYVSNPKEFHDLINKRLGRKNMSIKKWTLINQITTRKILSELENKSKSNKQIGFSKIKDHSDLIKKIDLKNSKKILRLNNIYRKALDND